MLIRRRKGMEMDLFPFLSVLACTIGTLILLVVVISTGVLGDKRTVTILPQTDNAINATKRPRYIDCTGQGAIVLPEQQFISNEQIVSNLALATILDEISSQKASQYIIISIRPDGYACFESMRVLIESKGIDIGFEPIDAGWKLKVKESQ